MLPGWRAAAACPRGPAARSPSPHWRPCTAHHITTGFPQHWIKRPGSRNNTQLLLLYHNDRSFQDATNSFIYPICSAVIVETCAGLRRSGPVSGLSADWPRVGRECCSAAAVAGLHNSSALFSFTVSNSKVGRARECGPRQSLQRR